MPSDPLVTCIMPTRGRPSFAAAALACFESQTWANRELVIVDDSDSPSFHDRDWPANILYCRTSQRRSIGAKRNIAVAHARGSIIAHFDDDDWSAPTRLEEQVRRLESARITGYHSMTFLDFENRESWIYQGRLGYALGTSLCYRLDFWKSRPFPDLMVGEDNAIVMNVRGIVSVDAGSTMYASVHRNNTSNKRQHMSTKQWNRIAWPEWVAA